MKARVWAAVIAVVAEPSSTGPVGFATFRLLPLDSPCTLHAMLWPLLTIPLAILMIRPTKAGLIAMQYRERASEMGL